MADPIRIVGGGGSDGLQAQVGTNSRLWTESLDWGSSVARGQVSGVSAWSKIGFSPTLTTAVSDVWSKAGTITFPAAAMQMSVVSSDNTNDKAGGTGALKVTIYYLDNLYAEKTEEVTLNGTNQVDTAATNILRINGLKVTSAGATGVAAGNLTISDKATRAIVYSYITAGYTRARNSAYTVPAGKTLYVQSWTAGWGDSANQVNYARMFTRATQNEGVRTPGIFYPYTEVLCANSSTYIHFIIPTKIIEKVDIKVSGIASAAGVATSSLRGWIE